MAEPGSYAAPFRLDSTSLRPGDVTRGNAVPWQADFLSCRFDDQDQLGWWPAQRPDKISVGGVLERWQRGVGSWSEMVEHWHELGVVVPTAGADGTTVFVESERLLPAR